MNHRLFKLTLGPGVFVALTMLLLMSGGGCESTEDILPPHIDHTPLALDPTEDVELPNWWFGDGVMMHLESTGMFAHFASLNRYKEPTQIGRWGRPTFYAVSTEPYWPPRAEHASWRLGRDEDGLYLRSEDGLLWRSAAAPPHAPEDDIMGHWISSRTNLMLTSELTWTITMRDEPDDDASTTHLNQHGSWSLDGDVVVLEHQFGAVSPRRLRLQDDDNVLAGNGIRYERVQPDQDDEGGA